MAGSLLFIGTKKQMRQFATALDYNDIPLVGSLTSINPGVCLELLDGAELHISEVGDRHEDYIINLKHDFSIRALLAVGDPDEQSVGNLMNMRGYDSMHDYLNWCDEHAVEKAPEFPDVVYFKEEHAQTAKTFFGVNFPKEAFYLVKGTIEGYDLTSVRYPRMSMTIGPTLMSKALTGAPDPQYHKVHTTAPRSNTEHSDLPSGLQHKPKGVTTMKSTVTAQMAGNKAAAIMAAEITAGKVLNNKVVSIIKPKMPMMIRGYMDSPLATVAIANAVGIALKQYMPNSSKAVKVSELMLNASALQLMESFNIETMFEELLAGITLPETTEEINND